MSFYEARQFSPLEYLFGEDSNGLRHCCQENHVDYPFAMPIQRTAAGLVSYTCAGFDILSVLSVCIGFSSTNLVLRSMHVSKEAP